MKLWTCKNYLLAACIVCVMACQPARQKTTFNIVTYGAKGDSITLNTTAIQKAIDACSTAGGGTVLIPPGKFLTGTLTLKSNITYHFENGASLVGSGNINHYNKPEGENNIMLIRYRQNETPPQTLRVLLDGTGVENVSFTGRGIIEGNGDKFWDKDFKALERPEPWISFRNARNITIRDLQFNNAPAHVLRFANSSHIVIDGIKITNHPQSPNTDGIDIVDTQNVMISNSFISTGDDAICLKTDTGGLVENVVVTNCIIESDDAAIKFGTGSASVTRYCAFTNNVIRKSRYGVSMFMLEGGTFAHNRFSDLIMTGGSRHKHEYPIFIDVDQKRPTDGYGIIRDNVFNNLTIVTSGKILITGRPEVPIENLQFSNIAMRIEGEADFSKATKPRGNKNFPKLESSIDRASVPAHLTFGHIKGLKLLNVNITNDSTGVRKDIDITGVSNLSINQCTGRDLEKINSFR
jgi:hypothetical protein